MKFVLSLVGWVLTIGATLNAALALYALYAIGQGGFHDWSMSVNALIDDHARFLAPLRSAAAAILPPSVMKLSFDLPALILLPARAAILGIVGALALRAGRR